jgi:hypothetical protein
MYMHKYVHTYFRTYMHTYIHTYAQANERHRIHRPYLIIGTQADFRWRISANSDSGENFKTLKVKSPNAENVGKIGKLKSWDKQILFEVEKYEIFYKKKVMYFHMALIEAFQIIQSIWRYLEYLIVAFLRMLFIIVKLWI